MRALLRGRGTGLTPGQRYHFVAGWLPWLADGFNLLFNLRRARAGRWSMVLFPRHIEPPLMMFSVLPLSLFVFKLVKLVHLYRARVGATFAQTIAAALAGLGALAHHRLRDAERPGDRNEPFFRTPKRATRHAWLQALAAAREEAFLMCGLWFAAFAVSSIPDMDGDKPGLVGSPDLTVWVTVLLVQSIPYVAAVIVSIVSSLQLRGDWIGEAGDACRAERRGAGCGAGIRAGASGNNRATAGGAPG